ncbi:PREDICTED: zinc carboxypeptidase A 1-like, partial [Wasmannia auropunctata]|uniref:zinc carboxypeptidase A 1-like n=1 Tax=Wasmannia auropunctata TaxID=64793 RepID=UPI0005F09150
MLLIGNYYYIWKIIILCTVGLVIAKKATFDNYKVFKIVVTTQMQAERLKQLTDAVLDGFSFWRDPLVNKEVELMVAPHKLPEFYEVMAQIQASYDVYIENVQALINRATPRIASTTFDFRSYHTLDTIYKNLDDLAKQYPDKVQTIVGGKTYEGRPIKGVKVSFKPNNPGIFLEGGIHAREWI